MSVAAGNGDDDLDPRVERSRRIIQEAVIAEMATVGYGAMTVEAVAKRAGVSKATIYRQWKSKLEIVESALHQIKDDMDLDEAAPPRQRLVDMMTWFAAYLADPDNPSAACMPALVSASHYDDDVRDFHHRFSQERRAVLLEILIEGQRRGEIDPALEPELTADLLVGPLFYRRLMCATPFPPSDIPTLVDTVLG